jgi:hypothetical protein
MSITPLYLSNKIPNYTDYAGLPHRCRIVNYPYYKEESISSIGSGTVESTIKRIELRGKISAAGWNIENVSSILDLRGAYLNGQLSI